MEFLLGQYCSSDDPEIIEQGVESVKKILADNFVRPDEAQKILSLLRQKGSHTVIDKITVSLNIKRDRYEAEFSNLGLSGVPIDEEYPTKFDRLLCGGIWCIIRLEYDSNSDYDSGIISADGDYLRSKKKNQNDTPIKIINLNPIQMPHVDINELKEGRKQFTKEEWMDVLLRSIGMEPDMLDIRESGCFLPVCFRL